jgi:acyl carrier protein
MLAPDGRCKTLDAAADGYVRAEALGVLLLQAVCAGAGAGACLAVLAASAVNQDGRSSGLTAPNGPAQQEVLRAALASAGLAPRDVAGVEMHGTGTGLGDPIEVGALAATLGHGGAARPAAAAASGRPPHPRLLAAGKSWIGHSEAAAGVTGLLHAASALRAAAAQAVLHLAAPNPYLAAPLSGGGGGGWALPRQAAGLAFGGATGEAVVRGVSSFAFQGTNAHALLRAPPPAAGTGGGGAAPAAAAAMPWRRAHTWAAPPARLLVAAALPFAAAGSAGGPRVALEVRLDGPGAAWLRDNRIAGRAWLPTSAVLEVAAEAASLAAAGPPGAALLAGCVLPSGLPLGGGAGGAVDVRATLHAATGLVEVQAFVAAGAGADPLQRHQHALLFASLQASPPAAPARGAAGGALQPPSTPASAPARLAEWLLRHLGLGAAVAAGAGALAGVDAGGAPDAGGLVLAHPAALEAALQLEGASIAAAGQAGGQDQLVQPPLDDVLLLDDGQDRHEGRSGGLAAAAPPPPIKVPASIGAVWVDGGASDAEGRGRGLHAHAAPARAGGAYGGSVSSLRLLAPGAGGCRVVDAEFRPLAQQVGDWGGGVGVRFETLLALLSQASWRSHFPLPFLQATNEAWGLLGAAAGDFEAATGADADAPAPWTTDLSPWELETVVADAVATILGQPVRGRGAGAEQLAQRRQRLAVAGAGPPCWHTQATAGTAPASLPPSPQVPRDEPLMAAGLDSLGAVELRNALKERLGGLVLPPTLLYDHQTVSAIATFITEEIAGGSQVAGGSGSAAGGRPGTAAGAPGAAGDAGAPSGLLKLLRGAPAPRPLFLAAPGVANAQSAYFAFAQFLNWSDQVGLAGLCGAAEGAARPGRGATRSLVLPPTCALPTALAPRLLPSLPPPPFPSPPFLFLHPAHLRARKRQRPVHRRARTPERCRHPARPARGPLPSGRPLLRRRSRNGGGARAGELGPRCGARAGAAAGLAGGWGDAAGLGGRTKLPSSACFCRPAADPPATSPTAPSPCRPARSWTRRGRSRSARCSPTRPRLRRPTASSEPRQPIGVAGAGVAHAPAALPAALSSSHGAALRTRPPSPPPPTPAPQADGDDPGGPGQGRHGPGRGHGPPPRVQRVEGDEVGGRQGRPGARVCHPCLEGPSCAACPANCGLRTPPAPCPRRSAATPTSSTPPACLPAYPRSPACASATSSSPPFGASCATTT